MKHLRRSACLALGLAAAATLGAAGTATADETATVSGLVWFDRDQDQVQDAGEPGRDWERGLVQLYRDGALVGTYDTEQDGRYTLTGLAPGAYTLTYGEADRYVPSTPSTVDITVTAGEQATVDFGMRGASIAGQQWFDADFDGRWDANEDLLEPFSGPNWTQVTGPAYGWAEQDERGTYRVHDLPSGDGYVVGVGGPLGLPFTKEGRDSKVDWATGDSAPLSLTPGQDLTGINAGYADVPGDSAVSGSVTPDRTRVRVGEEVTYTAVLTNKAAVPDGVQVWMSYPSTGFELVDTEGLTTTIGPGYVSGSNSGMLEPRESITFTVVLRAIAPTDRATVEFTMLPSLYGDDNPRNDRKSFPVRVVS